MNLFPNGERGHTVPSDPFLKAVPLPFSSNGMETVRPDGYDDQMPHRDNVPDHANFHIYDKLLITSIMTSNMLCKVRVKVGL